MKKKKEKKLKKKLRRFQEVEKFWEKAMSDAEDQLQIVQDLIAETEERLGITSKDQAKNPPPILTEPFGLKPSFPMLSIVEGIARVLRASAHEPFEWPEELNEKGEDDVHKT